MTTLHRAEHSYRSVTFTYLLLIGAAVGISAFGIVMILSASTAVASHFFGDALFFVRRQMIYFGAGLALMVLLSFFNYRVLCRLSPLFMSIAIALLVTVLIPGIGTRAGGASRWLDLGPFNIQPSELSKLAIVLFAAHVLSSRAEGMKRLRDVVFPLIFAVGVATVLIFLQPDLGSTLVIWASVFCLLFVANIRLRHIFVIGSTWLLVVGVYVAMARYRMERVLSFLQKGADPQGSGFQLRQSLIALGSGGITGLGLGMSRQKYLYLPEPHTDFIFAIIGEEFGLVGTLVLLAGYLIIFLTAFYVAISAKDRLGRYVSIGVISLFMSQLFLNIFSVIGLLPVTGVPLPFVSFGGSSMLTMFASVGVLLNVSRLRHRKDISLREGGSDSQQEIISMRGRDRRPRLPRTSGGEALGFERGRGDHPDWLEMGN